MEFGLETQGDRKETLDQAGAGLFEALVNVCNAGGNVDVSKIPELKERNTGGLSLQRFISKYISEGLKAHPRGEELKEFMGIVTDQFVDTEKMPFASTTPKMDLKGALRKTAGGQR